MYANQNLDLEYLKMCQEQMLTDLHAEMAKLRKINAELNSKLLLDLRQNEREVSFYKVKSELSKERMEKKIFDLEKHVKELSIALNKQKKELDESKGQKLRITQMDDQIQHMATYCWSIKEINDKHVVDKALLMRKNTEYKNEIRRLQQCLLEINQNEKNDRNGSKMFGEMGGFGDMEQYSSTPDGNGDDDDVQAPSRPPHQQMFPPIHGSRRSASNFYNWSPSVAAAAFAESARFRAASNAARQQGEALDAAQVQAEAEAIPGPAPRANHQAVRMMQAQVAMRAQAQAVMQADAQARLVQALGVPGNAVFMPPQMFQFMPPHLVGPMMGQVLAEQQMAGMEQQVAGMEQQQQVLVVGQHQQMVGIAQPQMAEMVPPQMIGNGQPRIAGLEQGQQQQAELRAAEENEQPMLEGSDGEESDKGADGQEVGDRDEPMPGVEADDAPPDVMPVLWPRFIACNLAAQQHQRSNQQQQG